MSRNTLIAVAVATAMAAGPVLAQKPIAYPANKQSAQQKQKDDKECMAWAKQDTGIDPVAACRGAVAQAVTDDPDMLAAIQELSSSIF